MIACNHPLSFNNHKKISSTKLVYLILSGGLTVLQISMVGPINISSILVVIRILHKSVTGL